LLSNTDRCSSDLRGCACQRYAEVATEVCNVSRHGRRHREYHFAEAVVSPADQLEQKTHMTRHIRLEYWLESLVDGPVHQCKYASREAIAWICGMECKRRTDIGQETIGTMRIVIVIRQPGLSDIFDIQRLQRCGDNMYLVAVGSEFWMCFASTKGLVSHCVLRIDWIIESIRCLFVIRKGPHRGQ
jgi:hypothetical protein